MSPVSTTNDPAIGYTGKHAGRLAFDPIAARNPDRPKFRLDDYKEANEPRETTSSPTASYRSDRERKTEDSQSDRQSDNAAPTRTDSSDTAQRKPEQSQTSTKEQASATATNAGKAANGQSDTASAATKESAKKSVPDQPADTSAPADEGTESADDQSTPAEGVDTASSAQADIPTPEVIATPVVPEQKTAQASSEQAAAAANADNTKGQYAEAPAQKAAATPATTSRDPKLAALEKLTQTDQNTAAKTQSAVSGDDTTTFKLPVPWPPQAQSEASHQGKKSGAAGQPTTAPQPQTATPAQTNQAVPASTQTPAAPNGAGKKQSVEGNAQATAAIATKTTAETAAKPKIEIVSQEPAKPAVSAETALTASNRGLSAEGSAKQAALPTSEETIAAATALNSRAVRSNALGGSNVKRSNAVTASNENAGAKVPANPGQPNPAIAGQTTPTNPAATAFTAVTQPQNSVTTQEQLASVRQQSSSTQRGQADPANTTSNASRAADLPAQGTSTGFADTLKSASVDRTVTTQDRQTLPTPATEQVKVKLVKAAHGGLDKIKIQLNPSELGKVEVRLEFGSDGGVRGTVIVDKPETMDLLQRDAKQLERALQDAGFKTGGDSLDFQMRGGGTNERQQQHAGSGNGPLSQDGGDLNGGDELPATDTTGSEHDGIGDDGSLNLVA